MTNNIKGLKRGLTGEVMSWKENGKIIYRYVCTATAVYGLGERYCSVNHKGKTFVNTTIDHFTQQKEDTYFPLPFYHANDGHGVFVDTGCEVTFRFEADFNVIELEEAAPHEIYFYYGSPAEIIAAFVRQTGKALLPPRWSFGIWASANRWNSQKQIEEQLEYFKEYHYPVSVLVIEAWSDEATFYLWNGAEYQEREGRMDFTLKDFSFREPWPDPVGMIEHIHEEGIRVVLWQCPVLKRLENGQTCNQHDKDCEHMVRQNLVVTKKDGTPYTILKQWFVGSMVPDFSNPDTAEWWKKKRRYLLDEMKIDGFKTDGGEFIHDKEAQFYNGMNGSEGRNPYPVLYQQVYQSLIGENRILFSRAGYIGAQKNPMFWAGDQLSQFKELRSQLNAGLSLSLSGIPFWSFDLGGFAGPMPDKELYLRATALAAFVPAMQWHSEPADGQFEEILKGSGGINDRSPWNMAQMLHDQEILETARFFANLHMNFVPYFYCEAQKAVEENLPFIRHLILDYDKDPLVWDIDDEYIIGDLLVAPVVCQGILKRKIYLPEDVWYDFLTGNKITGGRYMEKEVPLNRIPLYLREDGAVLLNLGTLMKLGGFIGNDVNNDNRLCIICAGNNVNYCYKDNLGNEIIIQSSEIVKSNMDIDLIRVENIADMWI